jgi:hypothetical protein
MSGAPAIADGAIVAIAIRRKRGGLAGTKRRLLKKSAATVRGDLWNASKSVMVSRDRTVVLTIFLARYLQAHSLQTGAGGQRKSGDGDDEIDGQKRSKKTRRVKPLSGCLGLQPSMSGIRQHNLTTIGREDRGCIRGAER